jgi:hypothetical protein
MKTPSLLSRCALHGAAFALIAATFPTGQAAEEPKYTIQEVMQALHKGEVNVGKTILKGEGTAEDFKKLVPYYTSLPLQDPPKGDAKEWKERTTKLLQAAKALHEAKEGALDQYKTAVNCKACHSAHKPD